MHSIIKQSSNNVHSILNRKEAKVHIHRFIHWFAHLLLTVPRTDADIGHVYCWKTLFLYQLDLPMNCVLSNLDPKHVSSNWHFLHILSCCFPLCLISGIHLIFHGWIYRVPLNDASRYQNPCYKRTLTTKLASIKENKIPCIQLTTTTIHLQHVIRG